MDYSLKYDVRNVLFQEEKLHLVAQGELFQMVCLIVMFTTNPTFTKTVAFYEILYSLH